jgi:hypothetical protein
MKEASAQMKVNISLIILRVKRTTHMRMEPHTGYQVTMILVSTMMEMKVFYEVSMNATRISNLRRNHLKEIRSVVR